MKNKKILVLVILVTFLFGTILGGCDGNNVKAEANDTTHELESKKQDIGIDLEFVNSSQNVDEYRDTITGVHYLVYDHKNGYSGMGGMTVRYNADGTVFAD